MSVPRQPAPLVDRHFDLANLSAFFPRIEVRFEVVVVHPEKIRQFRRPHPPLPKVLFPASPGRLRAGWALGRFRGSNGPLGVDSKHI